MEKIAVITGATSGYGLATAKKLKREGYLVVVASRSPEKVSAVVAEGGSADGYVMDVTSYTDWLGLRRYVTEKYGRIDVLVNNAGGGVAIKPVDQTQKEEIDRIVALNLTSVIYGANVFAEVMKRQGEGTIVNISSVCARHCWGGWSVYAAAKAGVLNFSKGLHVELQPHGVRVTCVIPAAASTGFQSAAGIGAVEQSLSADDVAAAVYYAVSQPAGVVVEELTVWGMTQRVEPM